MDRPGDDTTLTILIQRAVDACIEKLGVRRAERLEIPTMQVNRYKFNGIGYGLGSTAEKVEVPANEFLYSKNLNETIATLPEVATAGKEIATGHPGFWSYIPEAHALELAREAVLISIYRMGSGEDPEETIQQVSTDLERFLTRDCPVAVASSPLANFDAPSEDRIEFSNGLWLRRLSARERSELVEHEPLFRGYMESLTAGEVCRVGWAIEAEAMPAQGQSAASYSIVAWMFAEPFDRLISSMRLFKEGRIGHHGITVWEGPWRRPSNGAGYVYPPTAILPLHPVYTLSREEIPELVKFVHRVDKTRAAEGEGYLRVAESRLNDTYYHVRDDDRLVDAVVALESLFLRTSTEGEHALRFSLVGTAILEADLEKRTEMRRLLARAYGTRSTIVHGGSVPEGFDVEGLVRLTKQAIRWYLDLSREISLKTVQDEAIGYLLGVNKQVSYRDYLNEKRARQQAGSSERNNLSLPDSAAH
jgi:hypothetical protein